MGKRRAQAPTNQQRWLTPASVRGQGLVVSLLPIDNNVWQRSVAGTRVGQINRGRVIARLRPRWSHQHIAPSRLRTPCRACCWLWCGLWDWFCRNCCWGWRRFLRCLGPLLVNWILRRDRVLYGYWNRIYWSSAWCFRRQCFWCTSWLLRAIGTQRYVPAVTMRQRAVIRAHISTISACVTAHMNWFVSAAKTAAPSSCIRFRYEP